MNKKILYKLENVEKTILESTKTLEIFKNINLIIHSGEAISIVGTSGTGKSTLLHLMGLLDIPTSGKVVFDGQDVQKLHADDKARVRNSSIGFVFQFHHLLPEFTTVENVAMQAIIAGMPRREAMEKAIDVLKRVGLGERLQHRVTTLSGGERQRAAIARAVLMQPQVLLADEPTGNLDEKSGASVEELLLELNRELGMTLIVVTHNNKLAASMGRTLELRTGELHEKTDI